MSLFQKSVEKKYLSELDSSLIEVKYKAFQAFFGNPERQQNIRNSKEEQFQEGFLRALFVHIFEYTLNPEPDFNLTTELKNVSNSKKVDGAILNNTGDAVAVIELKSTNTTDLDSIETQAFGYKNHQPKCVYVITSNFEKLRFYIEDAIDFIDFDLFNLTREQFALMWLCLSKENVLSNRPLDIKKSSIVQEEDITKKLYSDYSAFRKAVFNNLVKNNPETDKLLLFKKTQKLLDRFLFIFFAEDRMLLPPNSISIVIEQWIKFKEEDEYFPLYSRFKKYFGYMDTGFKGKKYDIFAYNGGLFRPDEILDNVLIDDDILFEHTQKLSVYNFDTDVDVNILGHIFEHSLVEIENIHAEINGEEVDSQKSKRKKDGIFYTPKYITQYIVENTIGRLCNEKRSELNIVDEDYARGRKNRKKTTIIELDGKLAAYREWLLSLTILDPACGSGAFLNQALDFLIKEHEKVNVLDSQLHEENLGLHDIETDILERNIYGVDINEESVEIAKLSLWLRTAQKGRKLNSLTDNIKCGNSLIDDPEVAGDKAFKWEEEFPDVFANGGFDVVIGNPPYVTRGMPKVLKDFIISNFQTAQYQLDLYVSFIERGVLMSKGKGMVSYIVPNSWLKNMMMSACRKFLLENLDMKTIIPNLENVFTEASVDTMVFVGIKQNVGKKTEISEFKKKQLCLKHSIDQRRFFSNEGFIYDVEISNEILPIIQKMSIEITNVGDLFDVIRGINPYDKYTGQSPEIIASRAYHSDYKKNETFVPELKGMHTSRYNYTWDNKHFISYGDWLAAPRKLQYFDGERIVFREILGRTLVSTLISEEFKIDRSLYIAKLEDDQKNLFEIKFILGILNSKLMAFYFRYTNNEFDNLFPKIRVAEFKNLPIKKIDIKEQNQLATRVDKMLISSKEKNIKLGSFQKYISSQFPIESLTKKLQKWQILDFSDFIKELNKDIKKSGGSKLSKLDEMEWMEVFEAKKSEVQALQTEIDKTDREIDLMVYELYGLNEEEIAIVEGSGT